MKTESQEWNSRIALKIDDETHNQIQILRDKHCINISAVCRNAIAALFVKLEGGSNVGGKE